MQHYRERSDAGIDGYCARAPGRIRKAERFSWWFARPTHRFPDTDDFDRRLQAAELGYIRGSGAAQRVLAKNDVGRPLEAA